MTISKMIEIIDLFGINRSKLARDIGIHRDVFYRQSMKPDHKLKITMKPGTKKKLQAYFENMKIKLEDI